MKMDKTEIEWIWVFNGKTNHFPSAVFTQRHLAETWIRENKLTGVLTAYPEVDENIGKMAIVDFESGDYEVDETGLKAARKLRTKHPNARLFGIRIGYNVAVSFGGIMERVHKRSQAS